MKMWRRYGSTGTSTPAIRPIRRACGPAALTTIRVSIVPRVVSTAATRPASTRIPVTSVSRAIGDACRLRRLREAHGDAVGIGDAIALAERRADGAVHVEPRRQPRRVRGVEPLHVHTEAALQRDVPAKRLDARRRRQQKQIAVLVEVDRIAHLVGEPLQHADRFDGEADVRLVRELMPDAAGVPPGRSGPEQRVALDEHDVGDAAPGEMIRHARPHAPAADDHDIRGPLHGCTLLVARI